MPLQKAQEYVQRESIRYMKEQNKHNNARVSNKERQSSFEDCNETPFERLVQLLEVGGWTGVPFVKKNREKIEHILNKCYGTMSAWEAPPSKQQLAVGTVLALASTVHGLGYNICGRKFQDLLVGAGASAGKTRIALVYIIMLGLIHDDAHVQE